MTRPLALAVLAVVLVPASATAVTPRPVQYTREVEGTNAFVGIVKRGDRFRAYVSDATPKGATLSVWFRGDLGTDALARQSATGTLTLPDGRAFRFLADSGFGGGLIERSYRHEDQPYLSGWVVLR